MDATSNFTREEGVGWFYKHKLLSNRTSAFMELAYQQGIQEGRALHQKEKEEFVNELQAKIILVTPATVFTRDNTNRLKDWQSLKAKFLKEKK